MRHLFVIYCPVIMTSYNIIGTAAEVAAHQEDRVGRNSGLAAVVEVIG